MWSKNVLLLGMLLIIPLVNHPVSGQENDSCQDPRGDQGRCINIKSCEPLLTILRQYGNTAKDFLRRSLCSYENSDPIVCCPEPPNNNNPNRNNPNNNQKTNIDNETPLVPSQPGTNTYGPLSSPQCGYTDVKYPRIVNGVPAQLGAWPWVALLGYRSKTNPRNPRWLCGGVLISARHVLTAGHCVFKRNDLYIVRLGELDLEDENEGATPIDIPIEKRDVHPQYSSTAYTSDIAVLRLSQDVQFTDLIKPICLPVDRDIQQKDLSNAFPFVVGWGSVYYNGPTAPKLQQLQVPIVQEGRCKAAYKGKGATIDERVLCAGFAVGGKDACQGDSGGPLMYPIGNTWYSIGVVSFGFRCALPGFPGVYSKTISFLDFVVPLLN